MGVGVESPLVVLRLISEQAAAALIDGRLPGEATFAADYPTEFTHEFASSIGDGAPLGPYFVHRVTDDVVVGEIGGSFVAPRTIEIGYALAGSARGQGFATDAVLALIGMARLHPDIDRLVAHTPLDRPASARVLVKAGFTQLGETDDDHGEVIERVKTWTITVVR